MDSNDPEETRRSVSLDPSATTQRRRHPMATNDVEMDAASSIDPTAAIAAPDRSSVLWVGLTTPECQTMKFPEYYEDVYGSSYFPRFEEFDELCLPPSTPTFTREYYPSVPTDETSLEGRAKRKQRHDLEQNHNRPFHYLSAVCGDGFGDPCCGDASEGIQSVHEGMVPYANDMACLLRELMSDDGRDASLALPTTGSLTSFDAPLPQEIAATVSIKRERRVGDEGIRGGVLTNGDDVTECIAVIAPKIKRKRIREVPKRKGTASEGRSSRFRGVTKHRRSGRWEAHIWIKEMGRQVYLGGYEKEEHAAEAYDVAAIKSKGEKVKTNFPHGKYRDLKAVMDSITMDELVMIVRRQSQGFSRGTSVFRGVTHHPSGRWEARIGIPGNRNRSGYACSVWL